LKHATTTTKTEVAKVRAERKENHWHCRRKHFCYTTMTVLLLWQTQRFYSNCLMQGGSVATSLFFAYVRYFKKEMYLFALKSINLFVF